MQTQDFAPSPLLTGRKFLLWLLGSFFVVAAVNGLMVYYAVHTFSGEIESHSYANGLTFNRTLEAIAAQRDMGWQVDGQVTAAGRGTVAVKATYRDRTNHSLTDLRVVAHFTRLTNEGEDFDAPVPHQDNGSYAADIPVPALGQWQVRLSAERDRERPYLLDYRVFVK